jgi:hypothetical protein
VLRAVFLRLEVVRQKRLAERVALVAMAAKVTKKEGLDVPQWANQRRSAARILPGYY